MKTRATALTFILSATSASAHAGVHLHPHGTGEGLAFVLMALGLIAGAFWVQRRM